jgi:hypothetical protein
MFVAKLPIPTCKHWSQQKTHTCVSSNKVKHPTNKQKQHMGVCKKKNTSPFKWFFQNIVFSLLSFFQALASHLDQRIHMSEEREKKKE